MLSIHNFRKCGTGLFSLVTVDYIIHDYGILGIFPFIFLVKNWQVGISTNHINIYHHFLMDMAEDKDIDIQCICSEDNPVDIMKKNTSESDLVKLMKRIKK